MKKTDAIIILGHRLEPGCKPSEDLKRRIDTAVAHWKETNAPIIMPCGGITPPHDKTEAEVMEEMLIERGVPKEIIHLEDKSRVTFENITNALSLLGTDKHVALVTSDYHVERALQDCVRAGLVAYGVGAVTPEGEYRDRMYAQEKRIAEEMAAYRAKGMTDQDITNSIIERMRKHGVFSADEINKKQ